MWIIEASGNGLVKWCVFFNKEEPTEERLKLILWGDDFDGNTTVKMYEIEAEDSDHEDILDYLDANDVDDLINIYIPDHGWKVKKSKKFFLNIQQ